MPASEHAVSGCLRPSDDGATGLAVYVLLAAIAAGVAAQGGYYASGRVLTAALTTVALVVALAGGARRAFPASLPILITGAALAGWVIARAAAARDGYDHAAAAAATLGCLLAAAMVLRGVGERDRERFVEALVGIGVMSAVLAWVGVAWRVPRLAVSAEHRMWRGGATLTYPNATAALLAMLALVAVGLLVSRPGSGTRSVATMLLLVGLGATLSRAGVLALLAGVCVLVAQVGVRALVQLAAPVLGALVALAALAPSLSASAPPRPLLAVLGLAVGVVATLVLTAVPGWWRAAAWTAAAGCAAVALVGQARSPALRSVLDSRWSLGSYSRGRGTRAALELIGEHPVAGTGVGRAWLFWQAPDGNGQAAQFVHNEYLQTAVDLGAVGVVLLLAVVTAAVITIRRGRTVERLSTACAVAALAAFVVHSGFDFLWHIAVLPVVAGALLGLAAPLGAGQPVDDASRAAAIGKDGTRPRVPGSRLPQLRDVRLRKGEDP